MAASFGHADPLYDEIYDQMNDMGRLESYLDAVDKDNPENYPADVWDRISRDRISRLKKVYDRPPPDADEEDGEPAVVLDTFVHGDHTIWTATSRPNANVVEQHWARFDSHHGHSSVRREVPPPATDRSDRLGPSKLEAEGERRPE